MSMHAEMVVFLSFLFISHFVFTSCYIVRSSSPVPIHIFLNNNYKSIRNYFYYERPRSLQIKSGHIAYFSSDAGERSLEYVCANTTALCLFQTDIHSVTDTADASQTMTDISARAEVLLPVLDMIGPLKLCSAPSYFFKRQPLVSPSEVHCRPWFIGFRPHEREGYVLYPNSEVQDGCSFAVHTWFMTKKNYQEMRSKKGATEVFVPLFNKTWSLPLHATFHTVIGGDVPSCFIMNPHSSDSGFKLQHSDVIHQIYAFKYDIVPTIANSREYRIKCSGMNWDEPNQKASKIEIMKSLKITFFQGPKITLPGGGNTIAFSSHNMSGSFMLQIYTTSPISSLTFERSGDTTPVASDKKQFFAEMKYSSPFDILSEYKVGIPWLTDDLSGDYVVKAKNEDKESSTFSMKIIKAKALQVMVSPSSRSVGVGVAVSFECLAIGNLVQSVSWKRDFESLQNGKYTVEIQEFGDGSSRQGVRLTLLKPQLQDSGHYKCTAENQFETTIETVQLSVWLPGSPQIDPEFRSDETTSRQLATSHGGRVLNITDEQIEWEYINSGAGAKKSTSISASFGGIVGVLVIMSIAALGALIAGLALAYQRYKQRAQTTGLGRGKKLENSERYCHPDQELGLLDEETGQQQPQDITVPDDVGGVSCDGESEDENAPLLGKTGKKKSRDKKSKRETDKEIKADKEGEKIDKAIGHKGGKKEKGGESTSKEQGERIPTDTDKSTKRDTAVAERKKVAPRDGEETVREKERGEAKDTETKVKAEKVKHIDEAKDREKLKEKMQGQNEADQLPMRDANETMKEMKRGEPRGSGQIETKDKDERVKERGKGGTKKENTRLIEAERVDRDETAKERKRGGPRDTAKGENKKDQGTTKRKKEDKNTPKIKEREAEAKDGEDKTKEETRRKNEEVGKRTELTRNGPSYKDQKAY